MPTERVKAGVCHIARLASEFLFAVDGALVSAQIAGPVFLQQIFRGEKEWESERRERVREEERDKGKEREIKKGKVKGREGKRNEKKA